MFDCSKGRKLRIENKDPGTFPEHYPGKHLPYCHTLLCDAGKGKKPHRANSADTGAYRSRIYRLQ
jgi:hypothetical protein